MADTSQAIPEQDRQDEHVWSFRGYQLGPNEFTTAMVHYYRGEISRANTWRTRLDSTTNWAVVVTATTISFALSSPTNHHAAIIISTILVTMFLTIEARRYRYFELFSVRTRLMEQDFFANMLVPPFAPGEDWAESLAESLLHPDFPISRLEAFGRRMRRNYFWIFIVLGLAWLLKMYLHPEIARDFGELLRRAAFGSLPGWLVLTLGLSYNGIILAIGVLTAGLQKASGEVLPKYGEFPVLSSLARVADDDIEAEKGRPQSHRVDFGPLSRRRRQLLALVITDEAKLISERVLHDLKRGTTALHGTGMYTGAEHEVLMIATTVTEVPQLRKLLSDTDEGAFMIVLPAHEVRGRGFETKRR